MASSDHLKRIKSSALSRGLALAKVSLSAGARAASHTVGNLFANENEKSERFKDMLISQIESLAHELGQLKGSLMKVGQMLSMYGEHFLPQEANTLLKSLQSQSPPLEWAQIEKVIKRQLSEEQLKLVEIDHNPSGSASLGQVHQARRKSDGKILAMKIQYPGVDKAIEGDLAALKSILSISKLIPKGHRYDELFNEVRTMLHQEVDYKKELQNTLEFRAFLANDPRYIIPEVIPELSTGRILTTTWEEGIPVDSPEVLALSQERRNALSLAMLELYFRELFEFGAVQTDPHFGNYRVRLGKSGEPDRLILLDFGAVRWLPKVFLEPYLKVVRGGFQRNPDLIIQGAKKLGFIRDEDSDAMKNIFVELCYTITEGFYSPDTPGVRADLFDATGAYSWGESDLPKRVAQKGGEFAIAFKLRPPPQEVVFLDRKMGGLFIFLSTLGAKMRSREKIAKYIND